MIQLKVFQHTAHLCPVGLDSVGVNSRNISVKASLHCIEKALKHDLFNNNYYYQ